MAPTANPTEPLQVNSNQITRVLEDISPTALAEVRDVRITSTPGDDLAEEDFGARVHSLLAPMTNLTSITICIPSMARLHPSNSLPKVLDIVRDTSLLHPQCRLGLAVHEAEQAWSALTILNRIVEMQLLIKTMEFSRAFFPVETLIQAAQSSGLASLTLHATQVFSSASSVDAATSIPTLTSLTLQAHSEAAPALDVLLQTASSTLTHLDLSAANDETGLTFQGREFPHLTHLSIHETLLPEAIGARMPALQDLTIPTLTHVDSCSALQKILQAFPQIQNVRISRAIAGDVTAALTRLFETHPSIDFTIIELAVRDPSHVTPGALAVSENLVNAGPPISGDWPLESGGRSYPRLKSIVLKVHDGGNCEEFLATLDAPNLERAPSIALIAKKKGKGGKK